MFSFFQSNTTNATHSYINHVPFAQKLAILTSCDEQQCWDLFSSVDREEQTKLFIQLPDHIKRDLYKKGSETQKDAWMEANNDHVTRLEECERDPNSADNFFFFMEHCKQACVRRNSQKITYIVKASDVIQFNLKPYKFQRKCIDRHMINIAKGIEESKMMYHPILVAFESLHNRVTILDGQHRWNALKLVSSDVLGNIDVQIDVILFDGACDDSIMQRYKHINTNMPIDPKHLDEELKYVHLVSLLKETFPTGIVSWDGKKKYPSHYVLDTLLKEELQLRNILSKMSPQDVVTKLIQINNHMAGSKEVASCLSQLQARTCSRDNMYLGIEFPAAIDVLDGKETKIAGTTFFLLNA